MKTTKGVETKKFGKRGKTAFNVLLLIDSEYWTPNLETIWDRLLW